MTSVNSKLDPSNRFDSSSIRLRFVPGLHEPFTAKDILDVLKMVNVRDLPVLVTRYRTVSEDDRSHAITVLSKTIEESNDHEMILKAASLLLSLEPNSPVIVANIPKILISMRGSTTTNQVIWQQTLEPARIPISNALVHLTKSVSKEEIGAWKSVRQIAVDWNHTDPNLLLTILLIGEYSDLEMVQSLPQSVANELKFIAAQQWNDVRKAMSPKPRAILSENLTQTIERHAGIATGSSVFLTRIPFEQFESTATEMRTGGYVPKSIATYISDQMRFVSAMFEPADSLREVSWDESFDSVDAIQTERKRDGWQPISVWPHLTNSTMDILWAKTTSSSNQILTDAGRSKGWLESFLSDYNFASGRELTVHQSNKIPKVVLSIDPRIDESSELLNPFTKTTELQTGPVDQVFFRRLEGRALEQEFVVLPVMSRKQFLERAEFLEPLGYEWTDALVESKTGNVGGFWKHDLIGLEKFGRARAKYALLTWLLGDPSIVLEELKLAPDPSVRAIIIDWIGRLDSSPERILSALGGRNGPIDLDQTQALLIAASKLPFGELSQSQLKTLIEGVAPWVSHEDSGVHAAADWLMKIKLNQSIIVKSKDQPSMVHRSWFTSPSNINFVVVNNTNPQLLKSDLRVPWLFHQDALIIKQPRVFAIGATEITDELFKEFLIELGVEKEYFSARTVKNGPANFALYIDILKFCRWLSERDGIPNDQIGLPEMDAINVDMKLPVDFLEKDGYRLPTATEWEIATRSGTVTACFFGNTMECLSTYAWHASNTQLHAEPVGRLAPNPLGLFDTTGNVYDIVLGAAGLGRWDLLEPPRVHLILNSGISVGMRGGSYLSNPVYCSSGSLHGIPLGAKDINAGFRILRVLRKN